MPSEGGGGEIVAELIHKGVLGGGIMDEAAKAKVLVSAQIAVLIATAFAGGDAQIAQDAAYNAVKNNYLTAKQLLERDEAIKSCWFPEIFCFALLDINKTAAEQSAELYVESKKCSFLGDCVRLYEIKRELEHQDIDEIISRLQSIYPNMDNSKISGMAYDYYMKSTSDFKISFEKTSEAIDSLLAVAAMKGGKGKGGSAVIPEIQIANKPLNRGSTGRSTPASLMEQFAMNEAMANPASGRELSNIKLTDPRWHHLDGWVKMEKRINGIEIHYVMNKITGSVDGFKFK